MWPYVVVLGCLLGLLVLCAATLLVRGGARLR